MDDLRLKMETDDQIENPRFSKDRFITEAYDEVNDFPPVVEGKRTVPVH